MYWSHHHGVTDIAHTLSLEFGKAKLSSEFSILRQEVLTEDCATLQDESVPTPLNMCLAFA